MPASITFLPVRLPPPPTTQRRTHTPLPGPAAQMNIDAAYAPHSILPNPALPYHRHSLGSPCPEPRGIWYRLTMNTLPRGQGTGNQQETVHLRPVAWPCLLFWTFVRTRPPR
ncbi:hypothetical protein CH63R_11135 [Colletotrichum higginsianum IMI 349063]|uniref:Uncharacterized protein n=1 Tax=Colletotrichum higginsianum (strain IMI 349063) TaxID=759273 RepID=A0A1B7XXE3_COLHI|nr:hypothetical protein CH63R_11135 [Colletotrichum higginsianum IMI 349063]OBR04432.1 hypothetical protein CH63R_11135 [Colletotrichum higginsianum IMI 349063]